MKLEILVFSLFCFVCLTYCDGVGHGHDDYEYSPYHYEYKVHDDKEYLDFGQEEEDDGAGNVHGYYHVMLPDGRHQRVDYHVSGYSGYIADVKYDGEAHHPSHHGHHGSGYHGRHGKSLGFSEQPTVEQKLQTDTLGSQQFGSSLGTAEHKLDGVTRQGKSLSFEAEPEELSQYSKQASSSHFGTHNFGGFARHGKSLGFEASPAPAHGTFNKHGSSEDLSHFGNFDRVGKSLDFETGNDHDQTKKFSTHSGSITFGSNPKSPDAIQSRQGKSLDLTSSRLGGTTKRKKSNLITITKTRIARANPVEIEQPKVLDEVKKPVTFFEFAPTNVKSPFPNNFHDELQLRSSKDTQKKKLTNHKKEKLENEKTRFPGLLEGKKDVINPKYTPKDITKEVSPIHKRFPSLIQQEVAEVVNLYEHKWENPESLLQNQHKIENLLSIQKEVEGLISAQKQIQNIENIQEHFQGGHIGQKDINHEGHAHQKELPLNQPKTSGHQEELGRPDNQQSGFLPVIRGRIIHAP